MSLVVILAFLPMAMARVQEKRLIYEQEQYEEWISYAHAVLEEEQYEDVITACNAAIALQTEGSQAYLLKGQALYEKGELADALLVFDEGKQNAVNEEEFSECQVWLNKIQTE